MDAQYVVFGHRLAVVQPVRTHAMEKKVFVTEICEDVKDVKLHKRRTLAARSRTITEDSISSVAASCLESQVLRKDRSVNKRTIS